MTHRAERPPLALAVALVVVTAGCATSLPSQGPEPLSGPSPGTAPGPWLIAEPPTVGPPHGNLTLEILEVGQAEAIMLHAGNHTLLVDTGGWRETSHGAVLDHLAADGASSIDTLIITHPDADHAGGCDEVLSVTDVDLVLHPGLTKDTVAWEDCQAAIRSEGAPVLTDAEIDPGHYVDLDAPLKVRLLWLDVEAADVNEGSLVAHVTYGNTTVLLTGDIGCGTEDRILASGFDLDVDVLKIAHHGSAGSTCDPWLSATTPRIGVISAAGDNAYGHPHPATLDRLEAHGVTVHRTDRQGTIVLETDGERWSVTPRRAPSTQQSQEASSSGSPRVQIAQIHADPPGNDNENLTGEWVELVNPTNTSVDLTRWRLLDEAQHTYRFPAGTTLPTDGTLRVHTGSGSDSATDLYWGRKQAVWNNDGDTARLEDDAGTGVDERRYP